MIPQTLNDLATDLSKCIAMADAVNNRYFFVETWEIKALITGELIIPNDPDATEEDRTFDDTGELSNAQIAMMVQRDNGELPTKNCKVVNE
jgi:hypothetical protein